MNQRVAVTATTSADSHDWLRYFDQVLVPRQNETKFEIDSKYLFVLKPEKSVGGFFFRVTIHKMDTRHDPPPGREIGSVTFGDVHPDEVETNIPSEEFEGLSDSDRLEAECAAMSYIAVDEDLLLTIRYPTKSQTDVEFKLTFTGYQSYVRITVGQCASLFAD